MSTNSIKKYLRSAYSDERLAMLLAHCEDGKLSYWSCCCFIGIPTANHALEGNNDFRGAIGTHYDVAKLNPLATHAEYEAAKWADSDRDLSDALIPLIRTEIARRDALKIQVTCNSKDSVDSLAQAVVKTL